MTAATHSEFSIKRNFCLKDIPTSPGLCFDEEKVHNSSFLESTWRHSSSGFSLSQFVLFLHVIPDRLDDDQIRVWRTGCCQTPCANKNLTALLQLMAK